VIVPGPTSCGCCGSTKLSKLGEDVTETLEIIPKQWKVIQHVREKFTCRACEKISQAAAPFHVLPRGFAGPSLLAMILFEKYGQHQPLNRQSERYAREGIDLSLSTLADQVGGCATALRPLFALIEAHVLGAERVHGDDSTVPILAKGKTETGRIWVYVRDDKPFGGTAPSAALFYASSDRTREHPERHLSQFTGVFQADAFDGYNRLFLPDRKPSPITEYVGRIRGESFSNWPILPRMRGVEKVRRLSRHSRSRPSNGLTPCLISSVRSTACRLSNG
jgi:transposase